MWQTLKQRPTQFGDKKNVPNKVTKAAAFRAALYEHMQQQADKEATNEKTQ